MNDSKAALGVASAALIAALSCAAMFAIGTAFAALLVAVGGVR